MLCLAFFDKVNCKQISNIVWPVSSRRTVNKSLNKTGCHCVTRYRFAQESSPLTISVWKLILATRASRRCVSSQGLADDAQWNRQCMFRFTDTADFVTDIRNTFTLLNILYCFNVNLLLTPYQVLDTPKSAKCATDLHVHGTCIVSVIR